MQYYLFDLDGTLTDSKEGIVKGFAHALKHFDVIVEDLEDLNKCVGPPLGTSFKNFYNFDETQIEHAITKYREYYMDKGMLENAVYEGIEEVLEMLKNNGKTLFVATSKTEVYAKQIVEHFGLSKYFTEVVGSEFDGSRAKKVDIIKYILEKHNITDLSEVVMIGDRKYDIIGANEVCERGIASIGVLYGYGSLEELETSGATYTVESVEHLRKFLETFPENL